MNSAIGRFNDVLYQALKQNKKFLLKRPGYMLTFRGIAQTQKVQAAVRTKYDADESLIVPPVMIISITNDCNLSCAGCYACNQNREKSEELSMADIARVVDEGVKLGVSVIMIAGGEPLVKKGILELPKRHPNIVFVMFTNGLLIKEQEMKQLKQTRNLVPVLSLEGNQILTDSRRGKGVYTAVTKVMDAMDNNHLLFGTSITLTSQNYDYIVNSGYLKSLEEKGCRAAFLIEYVPSGEDEHLCLTEDQKAHLRESTDFSPLNMLTVLLPGDEDKYGGCLAAGRGFIHISSTGSVEACPFAPYSDINIKRIPLKEALKSRLLKEIRDKHHLLKESKGGCALNENKAWISELMR